MALNCHTSVSGCGRGFGLKYWSINGFGGKKARIGGFAYPIHPVPLVMSGRSAENTAPFLFFRSEPQLTERLEEAIQNDAV